MSAKSRNLPTRKKRYSLHEYIAAGLSVTQAKKARRVKAVPPPPRPKPAKTDAKSIYPEVTEVIKALDGKAARNTEGT